MRIIDRVGGNVYLRCWGDYYRYSLVITKGPEASLGRMAWRTNSQAALEAAAQRVEATGGAALGHIPLVLPQVPAFAARTGGGSGFRNGFFMQKVRGRPGRCFRAESRRRNDTGA